MFRVFVICDQHACHRDVESMDKWVTLAADQVRHKAVHLGWRLEGGSWFCPDHVKGSD